MRNKYMLIGVGIVVGVLLSSAVFVLAGNPDSPSAPGATNSFTVENIYNRLDSGADGAQSTFTEPGVAPGTGTMHTLNETMAKAPAKDDANGATTGDVLTTKTYWSRRTADWGHQSGTMPDNEGDNASTDQSRALGVSYFTAPVGYYDGDDRVSAIDAQVAALDADITGGKIKLGENIFGVGGTLTPDGGTAAADLFNGQTAHLTGDWTLDSGTLNLACNTATFDGALNLVANAYDGAGVGNNRWCMTDTGDAAAGDILQGKNAWVDGIEVTGNVAAGGNVDGANGSKTFNIPDGLYSGSKTCTANDTDLAAGNIKCGVTIFGVTGSIPEYVAKTGQTSCWNSSGGCICCTDTGQDGDYGNGGVPVVEPSFGSEFVKIICLDRL